VKISVALLTILFLMQSCATSEYKPDDARTHILTLPMDDTGSIVPSTSSKLYSAGDKWAVPMSTRRTVRELQQSYGFNIVDSWPLESISEYCVVIEVGNQVVPKILNDHRVTALQPVNRFKVMGALKYNDPQLNAQLGPNARSLEKLHEWSTGAGVRVGIVDTIIDRLHPDLRQRVISQEAFLAPGSDYLDSAHGTAIAGIVAAEADNGVGIVGFAPATEVYSYAACARSSVGSDTLCDSFSLAKAIEAAAEDRLDILNLSLAGPVDPLLFKLISSLSTEGTLIVASDNPDNPLDRFPASHPDVIAASTHQDARSTIENLVRTEDEHLTTRAGGGYQYYRGTSMTAARVTALLALLVEKTPGINSGEAIQWLVHGSRECLKDADSDRCLMLFALHLDEPLASGHGEE